MTQFLYFFWQICLMQHGPERAPVSSTFIIVILFVYTACSITQLSVASQNFDIVYGVELVLLGLIIESGCIWLLMAFKRLYSRFRATLVSLLGTASILVLMQIPVILLMLIAENDILIYAIEATYWVIILWWITVAGFILHKALDVSLILGMTIAFTLELLSLVTSSSLLPAEVSAQA